MCAPGYYVGSYPHVNGAMPHSCRGLPHTALVGVADQATGRHRGKPSPPHHLAGDDDETAPWKNVKDRRRWPLGDGRLRLLGQCQLSALNIAALHRSTTPLTTGETRCGRLVCRGAPVTRRPAATLYGFGHVPSSSVKARQPHNWVNEMPCPVAPPPSARRSSRSRPSQMPMRR